MFLLFHVLFVILALLLLTLPSSSFSSGHVISYRYGPAIAATTKRRTTSGASTIPLGMSKKKMNSFAKTQMDPSKLNPVRFKENSVVIIDVENVRGKSNFALSHMQLLHNIVTWTRISNLNGKVVLVVDHGSSHSAYWLPSYQGNTTTTTTALTAIAAGISVVFAGPSQKADDVIANSIPTFNNTVVVTADTELTSRCRKSSRPGAKTEFVYPGHFIDYLEAAKVQAQEQDTATSIVSDTVATSSSSLADPNANTNINSSSSPSPPDDITNDNTSQILTYEEELMNREIKLGGQLIQVENELKIKKNITNKRRKKLESKAQKLRENLFAAKSKKQGGGGASMFDQITSIMEGTTTEGQQQQDELMERWEQVRASSKRREATGDRVILAESMRRQVQKLAAAMEQEQTLGEQKETISNAVVLHPAQKYATLINKESNHDGHPPQPRRRLPNSSSLEQTNDDRQTNNDVATGEMVMSVDLGLRTGISLFNDLGKLVRFEQFYFDNVEQLRQNVYELIQKWESEVNEEDNDTNSNITQSLYQKKWSVTHIAIEGGDTVLLDAWCRVIDDYNNNNDNSGGDGAQKDCELQQQADSTTTTNNEINNDRAPIILYRISPEEWRAKLLTSKEKRSGADSKAAARLMAKQIIADYGGSSNINNNSGKKYKKEKIKTDVAESIVLGLYTARKLGWISREPAINRYTNGGIILPK